MNHLFFGRVLKRTVSAAECILVARQLIAILFMGMVSSCGYHFQGSTSILPNDIKSVYISPVENFTTEARLGVEVREALISRFERYGAIEVAEKKPQADAVLDVRILKLEARTRNVSGSNDVVLEQELAMVIGGELRRKSGQILWRTSGIQASSSFADVSDVVVTSSSSFAQSGIGSGSLGTLGSREVSRAQQDQALSDLTEEVTRKLYLEAVAADF